MHAKKTHATVAKYLQKSLELSSLLKSRSINEKKVADEVKAATRSSCGKQQRDRSCQITDRGSLLSAGTCPKTCLARFAAVSSRAATSHKPMSCSFITEIPRLLIAVAPMRAALTGTEKRRAFRRASCALKMLLLESRARTIFFSPPC